MEKKAPPALRKDYEDNLFVQIIRQAFVDIEREPYVQKFAADATNTERYLKRRELNAAADARRFLESAWFEEICEKLGLDPGTIRTTIEKLYKKEKERVDALPNKEVINEAVL